MVVPKMDGVTLEKAFLYCFTVFKPYYAIFFISFFLRLLIEIISPFCK